MLQTGSQQITRQEEEEPHKPKSHFFTFIFGQMLPSQQSGGVYQHMWASTATPGADRCKPAPAGLVCRLKTILINCISRKAWEEEDCSSSSNSTGGLGL